MGVPPARAKYLQPPQLDLNRFTDEYTRHLIRRRETLVFLADKSLTIFENQLAAYHFR